ncbi:MAG TPA: hypothetical protein PKD19_02255 [Candidatus Saccharibacteria bacterium]|nr:hypothetical protein [Candidatus Saccharibacteria bacterium]HMR38417.1 hypothetical protein [Candidatus Saccharibacteria bacterium]
MNKNISMTAVKFRLILSVCLVVIIGGTIAAAAFGYQLLSKRAEETSKVVYEAATSEERISGIQQSAKYLDENRDIVNRTKQVVAESQSYQYQDVIVSDLRNIARQSGISIVNFDFTTANGASSNNSSTAQQPAATSSDTEMIAQSQALSLKTTTVNITLKNPVEYTRLLNFLHHIEQNLTKMQIAKVSLSKSSDGSKNQVTTDALSIEVYVR